MRAAMKRWGVVGVAAAALVGVGSYAFLRTGGHLRRERIHVPHGPGAAVDDRSFPSDLVESWSLEIPEVISGLETLPPMKADGERELAVLGERSLFVVGREHGIRRSFAWEGFGASKWKRGRLLSVSDGGRRLLVFAAEGSAAVVAYTEVGSPIWQFVISTVADIATVTDRDGRAIVVVGAPDTIVALDTGGHELWRTRGRTPRWLAALDCTGDGVEDILTAWVGDASDDLTCLSRDDGHDVKTLEAPDDARWLSVVDLDGDGDRELLALGMETAPRVVHLSAWDDAAKPLYELRIGGDETPFGVRYAFGTFRAAERGSIVMSLPSGWIVGTTAGGRAFGLRIGGATSGAAGAPVTAVDFDRDGIDELVTGRGHRLVAYRAHD